ncbi:nitroreductase family protein [Salinisphaera sp. Q1T1-3]|uniref:nitroreductase family protein n=1 Tax=Salinisphaera sp. Q1T1-3 TaxID=2321229 RepID=UPI000E723551|nr:nitroreductase family protein [Salinisphaera sp. Q1T1-3]RJS95304.1 nitroreductase family protein [Salinisphaera sp. Q1T1-3]
MEVLEAIRARRSVRKFDPDHRMTADEIDTLMQHVILSPTAFNIQNWRFVAVTDPARRTEIRKAAWDQSQVTEASLLLVLCMDLRSWEKSPERYWRNAPAKVSESMIREIRHFYRDDDMLQRDEGMRSCGMAAQTAMLAAKAMGYDSCPMDGFDFKRVGHLIDLPADHRICMMICIGRSMAQAHPRAGQLDLDEVYMQDGFA